ncbi:MAG: amidohydrolase family protein [Actinomycetia bacterium]|nr:amidohydrolase family protein [Actinomycetes bacterium]
MIVVIGNGNVLDPQAGEVIGERTVVTEGDRIVDLIEGPYKGTADLEIDAAGRFVLPGLIDAHVHHTFPTMDFARLVRMSLTELSIGMAQTAEAILNRGFTTVRDTGGAIGGLVAAIENGMVPGPRIARAGRAISQTGGHGDFRAGGSVELPTCGCQIHTDHHGNAQIADGPDACRKAARFELRDGADFLKIMSSGGVASPADPFDAVQYTAEEIEAITTEATHRHTYVTSHAYIPEAIRLAVNNGVRCIEHGNLLDASTAEHLAAMGTTMVPTLVTYQAMEDLGAKAGLPEVNLAKNRGVFAAGQRSVEIAKAAGVELGLGTDLLGEAQSRQNRELAIRAELEPAVDVLRSMYVTNARLCGLEGEIGVVGIGAYADIVVSDVDPIEDLRGLAEPEANLPVIIKAGQPVRIRTEN